MAFNSLPVQSKLPSHTPLTLEQYQLLVKRVLLVNTESVRKVVDENEEPLVCQAAAARLKSHDLEELTEPGTRVARASGSQGSRSSRGSVLDRGRCR